MDNQTSSTHPQGLTAFGAAIDAPDDVDVLLTSLSELDLNAPAQATNLRQATFSVSGSLCQYMVDHNHKGKVIEPCEVHLVIPLWFLRFLKRHLVQLRATKEELNEAEPELEALKHQVENLKSKVSLRKGEFVRYISEISNGSSKDLDSVAVDMDRGLENIQESVKKLMIRMRKCEEEATEPRKMM
ncbi:hypothetical protein V8F06_010107 [Rhypophila decipiens]